MLISQNLGIAILKQMVLNKVNLNMVLLEVL